MYSCPKCNNLLARERERSCSTCKIELIFCHQCEKYSELKWNNAKESPAVFAICQHCSKVMPNSVHVRKSNIYQYYNYAFKFVNRHGVPYPMYFRGQFPFGEITEDIGDYVNDFNFVHGNNESTDWGTARAYKVVFQNGAEDEKCIALSHESGLEVFLIAAGVFIGTEGGKIILKRSLEIIEKSINQWWERKSDHRDTSVVQTKANEPLVERIAVRTPYWELSIDGRFSQDERERLIEHIASVAKPTETIEEFVTTIDKDIFREKIISASKKIVKRF